MASSSPQRRLTLLLINPNTVDDARPVLEAVSDHLIEVSSCEQVVSVLRQHPIRLIVVPGPWVEACVDAVSLASIPQRPPILALTAPSEAAVQAALGAGADDCLTLPLIPALVRRRLDLLDGSHDADANLARVAAAEHEQRALAEALRDTAAALNSTLHLDEVLDLILMQVQKVVPHDQMNLMLIDDDWARVVRCRGYDAYGDSPLGLGYAVSTTRNMQYIRETGLPVLLPDVRSYEGWLTNEYTRWIRSYIGVPIQINGRVIGLMNLDSTVTNGFTADHVERLQAFADQAAMAIHNAHLYDELRRQAEALEQRVAERTAELESGRAQLQAVLDSMSEGVTFNRGFEHFYVNRALCDLTGYCAEEFDAVENLGKILYGDLPAGQRQTYARKLYELAMETGTIDREMTIYGKDGGTFEARVVFTRVTTADGQPIGVLTLIRNISREKALEAQKARFVASASHELRTPLTNLKTRLYLLRRQPERLETHLQILEEITDRMRWLVENLLDLSRFERGAIALQRREVTIQRLIEDVVRLQQPEADSKDITFTTHLPPEPILVFADPERLIQVITNLVGNAVNYTLLGGRVDIRVELVDYDSVVHVAVEDTGIGIAPDHLEHIFQPFFRGVNSGEGAGLGLSIAQQIVDLHGGRIEAESQEGRGSVFHVYLPVIHIVPQGAGSASENGAH